MTDWLNNNNTQMKFVYISWRRKWQPTPVFFPGEPNEQYEKAKSITAEDEPLRLEAVQWATGEEGKTIANRSRMNEELGQSGNDAQ